MPLIRTDSKNPDFVVLVRLLDAELAERDGDDTPFYSQYNGIAELHHVVIAYQNEIAVGCGAIKEYSADSMEVKRMYVPKASRGKGIASQLLRELEVWAEELGYAKCILETGKRQPEAIALYKKNAYRVTANYAPYVGVDNSVCFEKILKP